MAMKYGIILSQNKELLSQNKELLNKLKKKKLINNAVNLLKFENEDLKSQLQEHKRKESMSELNGSAMYAHRLNSTLHNHKREDSSPMLKRNMPTSYSSSSFFNSCNIADLEIVNKSAGANKAQEKSIDSDLNGAIKHYGNSLKTTNDEDEGGQFKNSSDNKLNQQNPTMPIQQNTLDSLSNDQKTVVKALINKLLWEQKQRFKSEDF